ncbi:MAG: peptidoglycan DD-metalloendopeptidase family protein [Acidimicrobiia bacterium]|nr:peptidoglycan DD-metalloendopeptidase family protein [Acidimicrobiia bacterium]
MMGRRRRTSMLQAALAITFAAALVVAAIPSAPGAQGQLDQARAEAQAVAEQFGAAETEIGRLEREIADVQVALESARVAYEAAAAEMSEAAVERYVQAGEDLDLFAREEVDRQAQVAALSRIFSQRRSDDADRFRALRQDLDIRQDQLDQLLANQEDAVAELDARRAELLALVDHLEELARQQAEEERLRQEAAAQESAQAMTDDGAADDGAADESGGGSGREPAYIRSGAGGTCPVAGGSAFSNTWGDDRSGGRRHAGVDMFSNYGVPVVAVESGHAEENTGGAGGIGVYLTGSSGQSYYYAHLQEVGTTGSVSEGTVVGYVGDTGNARGTPHLHFEVHPGGWGTAVNPYPYVASRC